MKITIFGATGSLGKECLRCAKEMLKMLNTDEWIHGLPIIHY